jgi:hypothetical protein
VNEAMSHWGLLRPKKKQYFVIEWPSVSGITHSDEINRKQYKVREIGSSKKSVLRFEILIATLLKVKIFWGVTLVSVGEQFQTFR